jgi:hypothetical protein
MTTPRRLLRNLTLVSLALAWTLAWTSAGRCDDGSLPGFPLQPDEDHSLMARWKTKPVHESRIVDDMEGDGQWSVAGPCTVEYTTERAKDGVRSLRFRTSLRDEDYLGKHRGPFNSFTAAQGGGASASLRFAEPQDWSAFNRISLWVYVHPTNMHTFSFGLAFTCDGAPTGATSPRTAHLVHDLKPGQWNLVLWEIANLPRDKVSSFKIRQTLRGHGPDEDGKVIYDFDRLELQRVDADVYEGWQVDPRVIAYSQVGYRPLEPKVALAADSGDDRFEVVKADSGEVVLKGQAALTRNERGVFRRLDFSELRKPGTYCLRIGSLKTEPFPIGDDIWMDPLFKGINFFFCERCGFAVPGIHGVCHEDWQGIHGDVKKSINGGWHDAGDLSQGTWRTAMGVYAMTEVVGQLRDRDSRPALQERVVDELTWGLKWLLKTRFGDGFRSSWSTLRIYTDNKIGTVDDVITAAKNVPWENFLTAAAEVRASRLLGPQQAALAKQSLEAAEEDWQAAFASKKEWSEAELCEAAWGVMSSIELYRATGKPSYAEHARQFGALLLKCQQQRMDGIPITGYFYESTRRDRVVHNYHTAFNEAPLLAIEALCGTFPDDEHWMDWYAAGVLHADYFLKRGSRFSAPYDLLPNSVWRRSEVANNADAVRQFEEGTRLSDECRLRVFPIAPNELFHGSTAIHMSAAWSLAAAARLRGDLEGQQLATKQLEWVFGGNPFGQSLMYGEGNNFAPLFAYCLKNVVGALPVGMDSMSGDRPYWPGANTEATYKEIWVEPVSRLLGTLACCGLPAIVRGEAAAGVKTLEFHEKRTGAIQTVDVKPDGTFRALLEGGQWLVSGGGGQWSLQVVSGQEARLKCDPQRSLVVEARTTGTDRAAKTVNIEITAQGSGHHEFSLKTFNGRAAEPVKKITLDTNKAETIRWTLQVDRPDVPWVVTVMADGDRAPRGELCGCVEEK